MKKKEGDEAEAAAAAAAAETQAVIAHMLALTSCPTGTPIRPFTIDKENEAGTGGVTVGEGSSTWLSRTTCDSP